MKLEAEALKLEAEDVYEIYHMAEARPKTPFHQRKQVSAY